MRKLKLWLREDITGRWFIKDFADLFDPQQKHRLDGKTWSPDYDRFETGVYMSDAEWDEQRDLWILQGMLEAKQK